MGKLKGMTLAEKIGYIRDYYTLHIIAGVVAIAIIVWGLNHYILNPPPQTFLNVSFFGQFVPEDLRNTFAENLAESLINPNENYRVLVDIFFATGINPEFDMAMTQRMVAMVAAAEIDVFIIAPNEAESLFIEGFGLDLREMLHPDVFRQLYDMDAINFNEHLIPSSLQMEYLPYFQDFGVDFSDWVLVILPNTVREVAVSAFIDHILPYTD